ncbi:MAG: IS66 family transposase [Solirubrobacteraceae bacterium]
MARLPAQAPGPRPTPSRDRADPERTPATALRRFAEEQAHPLAPQVRQQPAQGLARALDLRDRRRRQPTNNPAERALRAAVIHRKVSLGTQSENGERFAERALSAAATCRLQHRSLFTYLSDLIAAHNRGDPFPALA